MPNYAIGPNYTRALNPDDPLRPGELALTTDDIDSAVIEHAAGVARDRTKEEKQAAITSDVRAEVNTERARRLHKGCPYTWPDGKSGAIQTRDVQDLININGQVSMALMLLSRGIKDPVLWFIDQENTKHTLTPDETIDMGVAVQQYISSLYDFGLSKKETVSKSEDPKSVDILAGWPE